MQLIPNHLRYTDEIEDYFFTPYYIQLSNEKTLPISQRKFHLQAATISSRLSSLNVFILFCKTRNVYIGLTNQELDAVALKITELNKKLSVFKMSRCDTSVIFPILFKVDGSSYTYASIRSFQIFLKLKLTLSF